MVSLNYALAELIRKKEVSLQNALNYSTNPIELRRLID